MKGEIKMDVQIISSGLTQILTLAGTILIAVLTAYINAHYSAKKIDTAKSIAELAYNFAEEVGRITGFKGVDKLAIALNQAKLQAGKLGINRTDEQWTGLIKATVFMARNTYDSIQGSALVPVTTSVDPLAAVEQTMPPMELIIAAIKPIMQQELAKLSVSLNYQVPDSIATVGVTPDPAPEADPVQQSA